MDHFPSADVDVRIAESATAAGHAAALRAADVIRGAIATQGEARVVFASAPSQEEMLAHLTQAPDIDWRRVRSFHMDEYLDLPADHPGCFGLWLSQRLPGAARETLERIRTDGGADNEATRYSELLDAAPIDLVCLGIGVNGHIAFNEPGEADLSDPETVRVVALDDTSRRQQVDDGLFPRISDVPTRALSLTVPALLSARSLVCTVVGAHKAPAVTRAAIGRIDASCPASFLRTHPDVRWFLDAAAASGLEHNASRSNDTLLA
ncbi:6-phosphogluconolactonase [Microbacterium esteraromaticum]|uniref:6-phosphogluconolactonase n=1 Tax=Microbacterium esteraromaticum TaxID=57043 RepID=UPI0019D33B9F|nr:6-phosphogluconolactonase [Microbacterium esteraromaticum]MBN7793887.1 6-phosphogluconolactonase [Microbacterium esteraromaticum]